MSRPEDWRVTLDKITNDLQNRVQTIQEGASLELIKLVETQERELQGSQLLADFVSDLNVRIAKLVKSNDSAVTYGGILVISSFLDLPFEGISKEVGQLIMHLADYLQIGIESSEMNVIKLSAKAIGKLSKVAAGRDTVGTAISEMVNNQIVKSCETWSEPNKFHDARKYAAISILAKVAKHSPTLFFVHLNRFFKVIWTAVCDPSLEIRMKASRAISYFLQFVQGRSNDRDYQLRFWLEIRREFLEGDTKKEREPHFIHGYLITLGNLLSHAVQFMKNTAEASTIVFNNKDHKDRLVRSTVITMLSKLAAVNAKEFVQKRHLENAMEYLTMNLKKSNLDLKDRATILVSIGEIAVAVKEYPNEFLQYVKPVMIEVTLVLSQAARSNKEHTTLQTVTSSVSTKGKGYKKDMQKRRSIENISQLKSYQPTVEALICIRNLFDAFPKIFQSEYKKADCLELLDIIMATGLREELIHTLDAIGSQMPDLTREIWNRLRKALKNIVMDYGHISKNKKLQSESREVEGELILALDTLATFRHGDLSDDFQKNIIVQFLDNDNVAIRAQASCSIAKLLLRTEQKLGDAQRSAFETASTMATLEKLLITGISDPDRSIRESIFEELQLMHTVPFLNQCLADPYTVNTLLLGLNDEVFRIRELVCVTIGRIIGINPTLIIPLLRKAVLQLLNQVKFGDIKVQERGIILLTALVVSCGQYMASYASAIIPLFLEKLRAHDQPLTLQMQSTNIGVSVIVSESNMPPVTIIRNAGVAKNALIGMGELSVYVKDQIVEYFDELLVIILRYLKDHSSVERRIVGLKVLGLLVGSSGYVIDPYFKYPDLLDILLDMIKNETKKELRRELIKVIGVLGAIDPYAHKTEIEKRKLLQMQEMIDEGSEINDLSLTSMNETLDRFDPSPDYYHIVAVKVLLKVLRSRTSSNFHGMALQALVKVMQQFWQSLSSSKQDESESAKNFVGTLMSSLCKAVLHSERPALLLNYIATIVRIIKGADHMHYIQQIFSLVNENWNTDALGDALLILEELFKTVSVDIVKAYIHLIIPKIMTLLHSDYSEDKTRTLTLLNTIGVIAKCFDEFLHIIVPPIVTLFENTEHTITIRIAAMQTLGILCKVLNFRENALQVVHPLGRLLCSPCPDNLKNLALKILCHLIYHIGSEYAIFIPVIRRAIANQPSLESGVYEKFVENLLKNTRSRNLQSELPQIGLLKVASESPSTSPPNDKRITREEPHGNVKEPIMVKKKEYIGSDGNAELAFNTKYINSLLKVNEAVLRQACKARSQSTKEDWFEWYRRFSIEIIRQSPESSIRFCVEIAQENQVLVKELFLAAFISCWNSIGVLAHDDISDNLSIAFRSTTLPSELLHVLLNLYEYLDHAKQLKVTKLDMDIELKELSKVAENCHAYAKALHYKELEFQLAPSSEIVGNLISLNNQLHQPHAAEGVLPIAEKFHIHLKESWYEKLHRWSDALRVYEAREMSQFTDPEQKPLSREEKLELLHGKIRCYFELSEWRRVYSGAKKLWRQVEKMNLQQPDQLAHKSRISVMGAKASWHVEDWQQMDIFCTAIKDDPVSLNFYCALKALHDGKYGEVRSHVQKTRDMIDDTLTALVSESYIRAYDEIVKLQQLAEIEEIITFKEAKDQHERQHVLNLWEKRLRGCQPTTSTWEKLLTVRSVAISQDANLGSWLHYASIAQKSGQLRLSHRVLTKLLGCDPAMQPLAPLPTNQPIVTFAYLKQIWAAGSYQMAIEGIIQFRKYLSKSPDTDRHLLMRVNLSLGSWLYQFNEDKLNETHLPQILDCYTKAMEYNHPPDYKAWKAWAQINFDLVQYYETAIKKKKYIGETKIKNRNNEMKTRRLQHVVSSVKGFFVAQNLSPAKVGELRYALRLLKLLFKYGNENEVYTAFRAGYSTSSVDTWLQVIPQIIARMDIPKKMVRRLIYDLLLLVGKEHPQSLVYPLSVSVQSQPLTKTGEKVQSPAHQIMNKMRHHSQKLLDQVVLVSQELIRIAITWLEEWYNTLEDAYGYFFDDGNVEAFFSILKPQHDKLNLGSSTLMETAFHQSFSRDLKEAEKCCAKYREDGNMMYLNQAWLYYLQVYKAVEVQRSNLKAIELKYASHELSQATNLDLAVPGTYSKDTKVTTIAKFQPILNIIPSKQRPRKMGIVSDQGKVYNFLLKGREDLRQDERVMQLFGLVNNLLQNDRATAGLHVLLKRFSVIPLSPSTGLIGWVPNCDTLNEIINEFRASQSPPILPKVELKVIDQLSNNNYYSLRPIQRQEIFTAMMKKFDGNDLKTMLWLKSPTSEAWLERRTNFTRTLALMSMTGYILGLGDRHPNNIMIERHTGHVVHIDFGDCFEVAMKRGISPEKIPFRLTRMLVNSMEVSGIEGSFRTTCEAVMGCLRYNKDSLMAVLEAFVHDPLINWRLVDNDNDMTIANPTTQAIHSENQSKTSDSLTVRAPHFPNIPFISTTMLDNKEPRTDKSKMVLSKSSNDVKEVFKETNGEPKSGIPKAFQLGRKNTISLQRRDSTFNKENIMEFRLNEFNLQRSNTVVDMGRDNDDAEGYGHKPAKELLNEQALSIVHRVKEKLTGQDFNIDQRETAETLSVELQVNRLIEQAMLTRNLCQGYFQGWCPFY